MGLLYRMYRIAFYATSDRYSLSECHPKRLAIPL